VAASGSSKVTRLCISHDGRLTVPELTKIFAAYGPIEPIVDRKRFAFVQYSSAKHATAAARAEMGRPLSDGRVLVVLPAQPRVTG